MAAIAAQHSSEDNLVATTEKLAASEKKLVKLDSAGFLVSTSFSVVATRLSSAKCRAAPAREGTLLSARDMLPAKETLRHLSKTDIG